ncbi:hypothetical protein PTSG_02872 [Salpingoeca rosetta]|uniref:Uncharacterized protein n=1 Tax=Salpingoeca rosetta (strain ATCC 50818 / BSB-021) TaxID=946362 RepID=F2U3K5_SALR5|nr:uncharacterized protein PTSG_02872 [Salpingoeca rosetta]EGD82199.1 hypothetical protein PTSG_02872 [Salpingoeca rosetta]|eukprot:XP_004996382.1 hypothetical protein PTSG_02872 [Salpingoeca rosetta]
MRTTAKKKRRSTCIMLPSSSSSPSRRRTMPLILFPLLLLVLPLTAHFAGFVAATEQWRREGALGPAEKIVPRDVVPASLDRQSWEAVPTDLPQQYFVERKVTNDGGLLFVFSNENESDDGLPPCDVSAVLSYRERLDPIHQILLTRVRQKGVCHFHLVVVLWDVAWAYHQIEEYGRLLETRSRTTLLIHRGSLTCYLCLRNMALPYISSSKYTLWADHGTLWKDDMMEQLLKIAKTDPSKPVVVAPHVFEFDNTDGHITGWGHGPRAETGHSHHPYDFLQLFDSGEQHPVSVKTATRFTSPPWAKENADLTPTDVTQPHVFLTTNEYFLQIMPHYEPSGHARLHYGMNMPLLRKFGRRRQLVYMRAEGVYPLPTSSAEASDFLTFTWKWEPMSNIQSTHYTNAFNGFLDLDFRCIHSDEQHRLQKMAMLERVPSARETHTALIIAQLSLGYWHQFCFVDGADAGRATHPMLLPAGAHGFTCDRWYTMAEAVGMLPFVPSAGIVFRSDFSVLRSVPFNLTAADELRQQWGAAVKTFPWSRVTPMAEGTVETKCLERRHAIAVISGLSEKLPAHRRLLRCLQHVSSLVLEEEQTAGSSGGHNKQGKALAKLALKQGEPRLQLWLLLKTRPLKKTPVPLRLFAEVLDDVVERVRKADPGGAGSTLGLRYLAADGDADEQYVLSRTHVRVRSLRYYRITLEELTDLLRPEW